MRHTHGEEAYDGGDGGGASRVGLQHLIGSDLSWEAGGRGSQGRVGRLKFKK